MSNIAALLKQELVRVARKQVRAEVEPLKAINAQHRKTIASLKAQLATLERQIVTLSRAKAPVAVVTDQEPASTVRFSAKGLKTHRARLGLSAADFARLLGVTAQTVYNWEQEASRPRGEQLARIAALRKMGKRDVQRVLQGAEDTQEAA